MDICIIAVLKSSDEALDRAHLFLQELVSFIHDTSSKLETGIVEQL